MDGLICPGCQSSHLRIGAQLSDGNLLFYVRCFDCGFTQNFTPVPSFTHEVFEPDKVILAVSDVIDLL